MCQKVSKYGPKFINHDSEQNFASNLKFNFTFLNFLFLKFYLKLDAPLMEKVGGSGSQKTFAFVFVLGRPVLGIRIRQFLGLPDPDPLVRGTDPYPAPDPTLFS